MPMPRLPATHHITIIRINAFQVKKKMDARAQACSPIMTRGHAPIDGLVECFVLL